MKLIGHLTLLLTLLPFTLLAQTKITGLVKNQRGQALAGANIAVNDSYDGASSGKDGKFSFTTTEKGSHTISISLAGFESFVKTINLDGIIIDLQVTLEIQATELNTVTVTAGAFEASDTKKAVMLNSLDIATTAGAEADIISALQTLPGTQTAGDQQGLFVRGGAASETKTYFDGLLVKNPFYSDLPDIATRGRFSPFLFKGTTFSAGGYSAEYGQALSSALLLESKDVEPKTSTNISLMTAGAGFAHTHRFKNSSLMAAVQYINLQPAYNVFKQRTYWDNEPKSIGTTLNYKLKTGKTGLFKLYSEYSDSKLGLYYDNLDKPESMNYYANQNANIYVNSTYQQFLSENWKINGGVSFSNNQDHLKVNSDSIRNIDRLYQGRFTITHFYGRLSALKVGAEWYNTMKYQRFNQLTRDFIDNMQAGFAETDLFFSKDLVARLGLRFEHSSVINQSSLAPRASLSYRTGNVSQVSLAYGKFHQTPGDDYVIQDRSVQFENAQHYMANYQVMTDKQTFRIEGYFKRYKNLVKQTIENTFNNSGNGYARGIDIFWRDKKTFKSVDYWVSYSFLDTKRNYQNFPTEATPSFGAKHTLNVVYKQYIGAIHSQVGATYTFASGRPYYNPNNSEFMADKTKQLHNLSMNISYLTRLMNQFTVVYLSVSNLPGFKNVYGYNYSTDGSTRRAIEPPSTRNIFIGVFISIGDNRMPD